MAQSDPALEAFDRLRVQAVEVWGGDTASTFLPRFQSTAASLGPDERIKLVVYTHESMKMLKAVLADSQASKICSLNWQYGGEEDVNLVAPLLVNRCPELASLWVDFGCQSTFDFVSSVLEHPGNKIKLFEMPRYAKGDIPRFFAALGQSQVSALTFNGCGSAEFYQGLSEYLVKDLLVRLKVWGHQQVVSKMVVLLANCTRLAKLEWAHDEQY